MANLFNPPKTVNGSLVGLDGNAFVLLGYFKQQARRQKWPAEDIDLVIKECQKGDYDNLICVLLDHIEEE